MVIHYAVRRSVLSSASWYHPWCVPFFLTYARSELSWCSVCFILFSASLVVADGFGWIQFVGWCGFVLPCRKPAFRSSRMYRTRRMPVAVVLPSTPRNHPHCPLYSNQRFCIVLIFMWFPISVIYRIRMIWIDFPSSLNWYYINCIVCTIPVVIIGRLRDLGTTDRPICCWLCDF